MHIAELNEADNLAIILGLAKSFLRSYAKVFQGNLQTFLALKKISICALSTLKVLRTDVPYDVLMYHIFKLHFSK